MPHKRAKRSVRIDLQSQRKTDLPPSQPVFTPNDIPKSMARVLNAEAVQTAFKARKRDGEEGAKISKGRGEATADAMKAGKKRKRDNEDGAKELKIQPGESLAHFRRRVDDDLRSTVTSAMKNISSSSKQKRKQSQKDVLSTKTLRSKSHLEDAGPDLGNNGRGKSAAGRRSASPDFVRFSASAPKRLNDIVQAPPELKGLSRLARLAERSKTKHNERSARKTSQEIDADGDILTAQQKRMMELEREKAINRYRALKESKLKESNKSLSTETGS